MRVATRVRPQGRIRRHAPVATYATCFALLIADISHAQSTTADRAPLVNFTISGDAISDPLTAQPGDSARGRAIVADRRVGLCLLCHRAPIPEEHAQGTLGTDLAGVGKRWNAGQLRLRLADASRWNPQTIMPSYYRVDGLQQVSRAFVGRPLLSAQQIEDVVAYLMSLND